MKNLKVKNILFSLLAILFISVSVTENTSAQITEYNNNVGIGITTPQHKLVVRGTTESGNSTNQSLLIENFSGGLTGIPGSNFGMKMRGPLYSHIVMDLQANDGGDGFYIRAPSNLVTINPPVIDKIIFAAKANGNVGIGTNNPSQKLHVEGNVYATGYVKSTSRNYYFGDVQKLYGDNNHGLHYNSNHSTTTMFSLRDKENKHYGSILGNGNGAYFGLLDGDGNWSYLAAKDNYTAFKINNVNIMYLKANGNVGIGFTAPETRLEVKGTVRATSSTTRNNRTEIGHTGYNAFINTVGSGNLWFRHDGNNMMGIKDSGKVVIGNVSTPSNNYRLFVEKGILTEKVKVAVKSTSDWSDYVFEEDYEVMPIAELEDYVAKNKHLPNVPSAEEVVKEGIDMAKMDAKLLEKIEEAHLYIIELHKEIQALKTQINDKQ